MSDVARDTRLPPSDGLEQDAIDPRTGDAPEYERDGLGAQDHLADAPGQPQLGGDPLHDPADVFSSTETGYAPAQSHAPLGAGQEHMYPQPGQDQAFQHPDAASGHAQSSAHDPAAQPHAGEHQPVQNSPGFGQSAHDTFGTVPEAHPQSAAPASSPDEDWVPPQPPASQPMPQQPVTAADVGAKPLPRINIQAFCEDQTTAGLLQQATNDRRLSKTHLSVQMGGVEAAAHYYRNAPTPNLIIIESMHDRDALVMDLDRLASVCDSGTKVIVIGHVNDVQLYRELLSRGVSEYLVMPLTVPQLMKSLSNLYTEPGSDPLGSVLAFVGAKGGVGSSTVCHNTAWAISQGMQSDVVIADLDLPFGTAGLDFNQDPVQGIADALLSPERLDEVLLDRLLSRCSDYLSLFAAPGTLDRPYDLSANACDVVVDVLRKNIPYIAVDVPHLWTEWAQRVLVQADRVVITAQPDLANLRNAKNLAEKLVSVRPNDLPPILVLNQLGMPKRPEIPVKDFTHALDIEPMAIIDFDSQLFGTAANNGQMIEEVSEKSKATEQFQALARALTDKTEIKPEPKSLLGPLLDKLSFKKPGKESNKKRTGKK